jgi:hypothetical protein
MLGKSIFSVILTEIGTVTLDVSINQNHVFPSRITQNPVEDGSVYADHVVLLPMILEIEGRVSDAPTTYSGFVDKATKGSIQAYQALVKLQRDRLPFTVVTGISTYQNMLLEELSIPRTSNDGQSIRFNAILREIQIIGKKTQTNRDLVADNVKHTAVPIQSNGVISRITV